MGNDLSTGYSFSGTSPNNAVTAEKLNAAVNDAAIKTTFLTGKSEESEMASGDYLLFYDASEGLFKKITNANAITSARGVPYASNLLINWAGNASVLVTADYILMRNPSNGALRVATAFSVTGNIGLGVALNGLDAGTESANTWYYLYAVSNGTTDRVLFTASAVAPSLPSGYVYYALLGAVRNDNSSNFRVFTQRGNIVSHEIGYDGATTGDARHMNPQTGSADFTSVAAGADNTVQEVDLANCVPPGITASVRGLIGVTGSGAAIRFVGLTSSTSGTLATPAGLSGLSLHRLAPFVPTTTSANAAATALCGFTDVRPFEALIVTSQKMGFACAAAAATAISMRTTGYTLALH